VKPSGKGKDMKNTAKTSLEVSPHHVGLSVPDLEASIKWYQEKLGFNLERQVFIQQIPARVAFLVNGGFRIELFEVAGASPLPEARRFPNQDLKTHGTKHLSLGVKDVLKTMEILKNRAVDVAMEGVVEGKPMAFIRDNSGNLIEINKMGRP
jgi:methylmalonyl-CoA/ethylmalonyl-CoA epimerase